MSRYDTLIESLKEQISSYEQFEQRGKSTVGTLLRGFAEYLEAPSGTCRVGPPDMGLDEEVSTPVELVAELRQDGWFAACFVIRESSPVGPRCNIVEAVL